VEAECGWAQPAPRCVRCTPHLTLYYHLSNSVSALAELLIVFLHKGLESMCEEQRAAMLAGTNRACAGRRGVCVSAELSGSYLQPSKQLTGSFPSNGQIQQFC